MAHVIDEAFIADVARATDCTFGSVLRRVCALEVRGRVGARIDRELMSRGFTPAPIRIHVAAPTKRAA